MAIVLNDDHEVFSNGERLIWPRDGNHSPSAFLTGFDTNDDIVFGRFTPEGKLKVDASVSLDNVDIGDVNILLKVGGINHQWNGVLNPDLTTYSALVQDPRMSFTADELNVRSAIIDTADAQINPATEDTLLVVESNTASIDSKLNTLGQKTMAGSVPVVISSDQSDIPIRMKDSSGVGLTSTLVNGRQALDVHQADTSFVVGGLAAVGLAPALSPVAVSGVDGAGLKRHILLDSTGKVQNDTVDRVSREAGRVLASEIRYATVSYATTDAFAVARTFDTAHYVTKELVIKNSGPNSARINILASIDGGSNFDVTLSSNALLISGNTMVVEESRAFTTIRVESRSATAGNSTTIDTRGYALGA